MRGVNKVIIVGNLGNDPEVKNFPNGGSITTISVATSEQWTDRNTGERREATEWHRIVLSNRLGEVAAQYLRRGSAVYIEGSLRTRKWQDQNGQDRWTTEIRANNMQMLDKKGDNMGGGMPNQGYQNNQSQGSQGGYQPNQPMQSQPMQNNYQSQPQQMLAQAATPAASAAPTIDDDDLPF